MITICGIEITQEHADKLKKITDSILNTRHPNNVKQEAQKFKIDFYITIRTNPHNKFKGTVSEYINQFLPEKRYLLPYM